MRKNNTLKTAFLYIPSPLFAAEEHCDEKELTMIIQRVTKDDLLSTIFADKSEKTMIFICCWPLAIMNLNSTLSL